MNSELFEALSLLEKERGIPEEYMIEQIRKAIVTACKNSYNNEEARVEVNREEGAFEVYLTKEVVEEVFEPNREITLEEARKIKPDIELEDTLEIRLNTKEFGRIAAQTARNIIRQGIRNGEKSLIFQEFQSREKEIVRAEVERIDPNNGNVILKIGKCEAVLTKREQIEGEVLKEGDTIQVFIVSAEETERGQNVIISRTHPQLVKWLFEKEIQEIKDGIIEIKAISREAGSRTKMAVLSHDENIDAVGACIGTKGMRVGNIVNELSGEKIDIVNYSDDPEEFIKAALSPASVTDVTIIDAEAKTCSVRVPENQLSLAIGNRGQNARLAAKLTGWKIDIRPESGFYGEELQDEAQTEEESEADA